MSGSWSFCGTLFTITVATLSCDVCRIAGPDIAGKTEFVTGKKKLKRESLVYHTKKVGNMKKCFNMVSAKANSLTYTSTFLAPVNHLQVLILQSFEKQLKKNEIGLIMKLSLLLPKK